MRAEVKILVLVGAAALLAACGKSAETPAATEAVPVDTAAPAAAPAAPAPVAEEDDEAAEHAKKALAALPAPYNAADLENGQRKFALCRSCHTITEGGPNMTGPNLFGVFGRTAGTAEKFNYSDAVKAAGFKWDAARLDNWLADPRGALPGNRMTFVGLKDPKDRTDVIAYLMIETARKSDDD
ncbi:MAG: cytochrome c family protein [Caulobacter sp.]|nr:cytochrome c family protein [Caulobacter sp.]